MAFKITTEELQRSMQKNTYEIYQAKTTRPLDVALHHHDFYEIYFFLSGNVQYNVESRSYLLTPGDVLLISPNELHQPVFGDAYASYERIVLWINKDFLRQLSVSNQDLSACFNTEAQSHTNLLRPVGNLRQLLNYQLEQLLKEWGSQDYLGEINALCYLVQVLVLLNRLARQQNRLPEPTGDSAVYSVLNYINSHYTEDLTLDMLSNQFFISKYHLSREFGRLTGTSVHRYIIQKRLVKAKQLMSDGAASSEVCQQCGFGDYSNFYRAFKAEYQMSPKEFSARVKESATEFNERAAFLRLGAEL